MAKRSETIKIGIDTGGTFTDVIAVVEGKTYTHKLLSTPENPALAVIQGVHEILAMPGIDAESVPVEVVHGSTVATNTLLERSGAKLALITTAGFEDILEIGRQTRSQLYDFFVNRPEPLVPAARRIGVAERTLHTGEIETPIDLAHVEEIAARLASADIDAVAVCFLFSYVNPTHERLAAERLSQLDLPISCSHQILPEYREYERFSTTVANAYVQPRVSTYVKSLASRLDGSFRLMQSNGGSISAQTASVEPIRTALSGPAAGVIGAYTVAKQADYERIISFDMGGTSTDVSLCDGKIALTTEGEIGAVPIKTPMIDIHTVGAGGGSIAELDAGGALRVGPKSAGADPGPICYGRGEALTVTDANLFLGRLDAAHFLGGKMRLHTERVAEHLGKLAVDINKTPTQAAEGIIAVANATMEKALRVISIERGHDAREFTLVCFGGAGGLHACELARSLAIPTVLIPPNGGLLSAYGMLLSNVVKDYAQTLLRKVEHADGTWKAEIEAVFEALVEKAEQEMETEGFEPEQLRLEPSLDMRYAGQSYELNVPFSDTFITTFHAAHEQRFGHARPDAPVEIVNLRLRVTGVTARPLVKPEALGDADATAARIGQKAVVFQDVRYNTAMYQREKLRPGNRIAGPAIIVEFSSTTVIPPDFCASVDGYRNLVIRQM